MRKVFAISALLGAVALSGCLSSIIPEPAPAETVYQLGPVGGAAVPSAAAVIYRVDRPTAPTGLMTNSIVVSPDGTRLATASGARWAERIPTLVQLSLFDELSTHSEFVGVLPTSGARSDYRLHLTIRHFEAKFDRGEKSAPLAVVQYTATVADAGTRKLIGTHNVSKEVRAGAVSVSSIVRAQDAANKAALDDVVAWLGTLNVES